MQFIWKNYLNAISIKKDKCRFWRAGIDTSAYLGLEGKKQEAPSDEAYVEKLTVAKILILFPFFKPLLVCLCKLCWMVSPFIVINGWGGKHEDSGYDENVRPEKQLFGDFRMMATFGLTPKFLGFGFLKDDDSWTYFQLGFFSLCFMDLRGSGRRSFNFDGEERKLAHDAVCPEFSFSKIKEPQPCSMTIVFDCWLRFGEKCKETDAVDEDYSSLTLSDIIDFLVKQKVIERVDHENLSTTKNPKKG